jgi:hypothetical protein
MSGQPCGFSVHNAIVLVHPADCFTHNGQIVGEHKVRPYLTFAIQAATKARTKNGNSR